MNNIQSSTIPPSPTAIISKGNSFASNHYLPLLDIAELQDVVADNFGPSVVFPDSSTLTEMQPDN